MVEFSPLLSNSGNLLCSYLWDRDHHITSNADVLLVLPLSLSPLSILLRAVHFGLAVRPRLFVRPIMRLLSRWNKTLTYAAC